MGRHRWGRRAALAAVLTPLVLTLAALGPADAPATTAAQEDEPLRVTTTTGMIADLAANIGGERVEVTALMGPGVDPHLYRPSAGDIRTLEEADLILYNGLELEGRMGDTLAQLERIGTPTAAVAEAIPTDQLRPSAQYEDQFDPHVWFDVTLWRQVAQAVKDELAAAEPESDALFQANLDAYLPQLDELDRYVRERIAAIPEGQRVLITAHDAFVYFGRQYGIEVRALQGTSTATEAGAGDVQALAEFIVARRIPAIFVETSVPQATIEAVQAAVRSRGFEVAIGGQLFSDAMGAAGTPEGTYLGMVRHNIDTIVAALAPTAVATPAA